MTGNHTPTPWAVWNVPVVNDKFHRKLGPMIILTGHDDDIVFAAEAVNSYASSQAEIERLRRGLDAILAVAPDTLGCGHRCSAEIDGQTEDDYAEGLRIARAALSGSKE